MPLALILNSHVAASRVGGSAQALALMPFKIDACVVPTVLYGRHPGWGAPGGATVPEEVMQGMLDGFAANGLYRMTDAVIAGYFKTPGQVEIAAAAIDKAREAKPNAVVIVDPVIGDTGRGLYVPEEVAEAIKALLVPRADILTPNLFELGQLTGLQPGDTAAIVEAARGLARGVLVTSVPGPEGEIGVLWVDGQKAILGSHPKLSWAPQGTGDLFCALFAAAAIEGLAPPYALGRAVSGIAEAVNAAQEWDAPELPIVALGERLVRPSVRVRIEAFQPTA